jgi:putative methyltransferase (TIGR04325 family)
LTARAALKTIFSREPCRSVLAWIQRTTGGRKILNRIYPAGGVYTSFEEGWAGARSTHLAGHEDPEEIRFHLNISEKLRSSDYAALYWLTRIGSGSLKVFDYGGNAGNLFYGYSRYLADTNLLAWIVCDIPSVNEEGRRIAHERGATMLSFADSARGVTKEHVVLVSGAFHYWENSVGEFLGQFAEAPQHILINRSPVHKTQPSFVTVQRTETCAFPCIVRNESGMISDFHANGYALIDQWRALELSLILPLYPLQSVSYYSGYYFKRELGDQEKTGTDQQKRKISRALPLGISRCTTS